VTGKLDTEVNFLPSDSRSPTTHSGTGTLSHSAMLFAISVSMLI
jgi:hypothetical protein